MLAAEAPYVPALQSAHATVPVYALYFPATHAEHGPPSGPVCPALQTQLLTTVPPLRELVVFTGQVLQLAEPALGLYFPGTHSMQVWPSSPVAPALHRQSD